MPTVEVTDGSKPQLFKADTAADLLRVVCQVFGEGWVKDSDNVALTDTYGSLNQGTYTWSAKQVPVAPSAASSPPGGADAVNLLLAKLKKCGVDRCPVNIRNKIMMLYPQQLVLAAFSTNDDDALHLYNSVKAEPATSTRCAVLDQASLAIKGPLGSALNLLGAADSVTGEPLVLKLLLKSDVWFSASSRSEKRAFDLLQLDALPEGVALVAQKLVIVKLDTTTAGHGEFHALLMKRFVITANELPPGLSLSYLVAQFRRVLRALQYMHKKRLVHGDVKGSNVLVDEKGDCKLSDMGSSTPVGDVVKSATEMWYPEKTMGKPARPHHDFGLLATMLATLCLKNEAPMGEEAKLASLRAKEDDTHVSGPKVVDVLRRAKGVGPLEGRPAQETEFRAFVTELLELCDGEQYPTL